MKNLPKVIGIIIILSIVITTQCLAQSIINGCYDKKGNLRIVTDSSDCKDKETFISWNQAGIQGKPGPAGPTGATGPAGPQGIQGPPGSANGITTAVHGNVNVEAGVASGAGWSLLYKDEGDPSYTRYIILLERMTDFDQGFPPTCVATPPMLHNVWPWATVAHWFGLSVPEWSYEKAAWTFSANSSFYFNNAMHPIPTSFSFICVQE